MPERSQLILKIACVALAALVIYELSLLASRWNPLGHASVPALPTLSSNRTDEAGSKGTNQVSTTASKPAKADTNSAATQKTDKTGTNSVASQKPREETNTVGSLKTDEPAAHAALSGKPERFETNAVASQPPQKQDTNTVTSLKPDAATTNAVVSAKPGNSGTNAVTSTKPGESGTNSSPTKVEAGRPPQSSGGAVMGMKAAALPPAVQARVDRIIQSELLAPVMRPQPMALLGIAGNSAFLRSSNGQTGVIKEGEEVGGLKLIRIGTNRVLIEETGQQKELMIFSGYGGESLMLKTNTP